MALKYMGIVDNYERIWECTVAVVEVGGGKECDMLTMWHWEGEKRGGEDLELKLRWGAWMGERGNEGRSRSYGGG